MTPTRIGRKTKLSLEMSESICRKIRLGCTRKYAAVASGICEKTFYNWLTEGEKNPTGIHFQFLQALKMAEAEAVASYEVELRKLAAKGNATAIIFYLQNRASDTWKDHRFVEHAGVDGAPIKLDLSALSTEELKKLATLDASSAGRDSETG
ncbi:MAG: hypothetical protein DDT37_01792 [Firmicutes bacterium]|nr:hypothetical protein [candidate division NPL-UPA2 bacterium]